PSLSTLFPYTTLFRSLLLRESADVLGRAGCHRRNHAGLGCVSGSSHQVVGSLRELLAQHGRRGRLVFTVTDGGGGGIHPGHHRRSEEHTSELQSRFDL